MTELQIVILIPLSEGFKESQATSELIDLRRGEQHPPAARLDVDGYVLIRRLPRRDNADWMWGSQIGL